MAASRRHSDTTTITASVPAAPTGLTATVQAGPPQTVLLSWTDNSADEIGFRIERADNVAFSQNLVPTVRTANTSVAPVTVTDADIIPGATYFYRVAAISTAGASAFATLAAPGSVTIPAAAGMQAGPAVPIAGFGPTSGFPLYYQDTLGTKLNLLPVTAVNLADGVIAGNAYSAALGFGTEAFYYAAGAQGLDIGAGSGLVEFAIEAIFVSPDGKAAPGQEAVMNRTRIRIEVPVSGNYTITTPYHQGANALQFPNVVAGVSGFDINFTADIFAATPRDFASTTTGPVNVFLRPTVPPATPGVLGDGLIAGTVTGGPNAVNSVTITGPGGINATTNQWLINGRFLAAAVTPSFTSNLNPANGVAPNAVTFTDTSPPGHRPPGPGTSATAPRATCRILPRLIPPPGTSSSS